MGAQLLWVFTSVSGRIGRQVYWLAWFFVLSMDVAILAAAVEVSIDPQTNVAQVNPPPGLMPFVAVISLPFQIVIGVKRLHDLNASGLFAIALLIFPASVIATILLGIIPGRPGPNRFGDQTDIMPPP